MDSNSFGNAVLCRLRPRLPLFFQLRLLVAGGRGKKKKRRSPNYGVFTEKKMLCESSSLLSCFISPDGFFLFVFCTQNTSLRHWCASNEVYLNVCGDSRWNNKPQTSWTCVCVCVCMTPSVCQSAHACLKHLPMHPVCVCVSCVCCVWKAHYQQVEVLLHHEFPPESWLISIIIIILTIISVLFLPGGARIPRPPGRARATRAPRNQGGFFSH